MKRTRNRPCKDPLESFHSKYVVDESGCWLWTGSIKPNGYAQMRHKEIPTGYAHRIGYLLHVGPIPDGLDLDHLCRVRHCVNPAHLEPVPRSVNLRRGMAGYICKDGSVSSNYGGYI